MFVKESYVHVSIDSSGVPIVNVKQMTVAPCLGSEVVFEVLSY